MSQTPEELLLFNEELIKKYPGSNRRLTLDVSAYGIAEVRAEIALESQVQTVHISPYGLQFRSLEAYPEGTLLKIHVALPDYWVRKQRLVDYSRVDTPHRFKILAKVVKTEEIGKRGKKRMVLVRTVNMDDVDEQVLKSYLQDG